MPNMRPKRGESSILLPAMFEYHGGRGFNFRSNLKLAIVLGLISIAVSVILGLTAPDIPVGFLRVLIVFVLYLLLLRFPLMHEGKYKRAYNALLASDYALPTEFWGISSIDSTYPHLCHYSNGLTGVFIKLEKDVLVGKPDGFEFDHYEAVGDAYNLLKKSKLGMMHIDYMDNVGNDPRMYNVQSALNTSTVKSLKTAVEGMYGYLQGIMRLNYSNYDVYLFYTPSHDENTFWKDVQRVCDRFMGGNYLAYSALGLASIHNLCESLNNMQGFSALKAMDMLYENSYENLIVPISCFVGGVEQKFNKTSKELAREHFVNDTHEIK